MPEDAPLSLFVPEPAVRPGDTPDFSSVRIARAGSVPRPPVDVEPETIRDLAFLDHPRAQPRGRGGRPLGGHADRRGTAATACGT